jgi:hypothetical protein
MELAGARPLRGRADAPVPARCRSCRVALRLRLGRLCAVHRARSGASAGLSGACAALRRTWVGPFDLDEAVTLDEIERLARTPEIDALLRPVALGARRSAGAAASRGGRGAAQERQSGPRPAGRGGVRRSRLGLLTAGSPWQSADSARASCIRTGVQPVTRFPLQWRARQRRVHDHAQPPEGRCGQRRRLFRLRALSLHADPGLGRGRRAGALHHAQPLDRDRGAERPDGRALRAPGAGAGLRRVPGAQHLRLARDGPAGDARRGRSGGARQRRGDRRQPALGRPRRLRLGHAWRASGPRAGGGAPAARDGGGFCTISG